MDIIKIDNSKKSAIKGKWKNPGANLYDRLMDSMAGDIPNEVGKYKEGIKNGDIIAWDRLLKEAYLVAPVNKIKNSPYGRTPFSRSGCKYPHHIIKDGKLIVSIPGLRAAYICARNQGCFDPNPNRRPPYSRSLISHINRHLKELELRAVWHHGDLYLMEESDMKIDENFQDIYSFIMEKTGIDLVDREVSEGLDNTIAISEDTLSYCRDMSHDSENITESVIEGSPENPVLSSDFNKEVGATTPQALWEWMHKNISYDNEGSKWRLRSAPQLYIDKKGNCHDQSYFASFILHSWGYDNWQLYFVEFKEDSDKGGNSHTLTYYLDKGKYYWFENAWEDQASIHGPYNSKEDIKQAVMDAYAHDYDLNSHGFDGIVFGEHPSYRLGMNLFDYCNAWHLQDDRRFNSDEIKEAAEWIDQFVHDEVFRESASITTMSDLIKECKTPEELNKWMKCIQYGWKDKSGKINGTGDNDETSHLFKEYRLQSPNQLIKSKVGLCWDYIELERQWFDHNKYPYAIIFVEVKDGDDCPTHVTLIYKQPGEHNEIYWFESAWGEARGIREFKDLETGLPKIVDEIVASFNTKGEKIIRMLTKAMPTGTTCEQYYDLAHKSPEVDMGDLFYDEIFNENGTIQITESSVEDESIEPPPNHKGYTMETLPKIMYFGSKSKHPIVQNDKVFLTPYIGIASIFIVDNSKNIAEEFKKQTGHYPERLSYNTSYKEWEEMESEDLMKPLKKVHITHNIKSMQQTISGSSKGYIHFIDITDIRDQLKLFSSNDPDREVYYDGGKPLKPMKIIEHSIKWEMTYSEANAKHHGQGIVERASVLPKENDLQWMNEYLCEASHSKLKSSFRMAANIKNGHFVKIVFDLIPESIKQLGDHTRQYARDQNADRERIRNIRNTGSTDFSSIGTVKAIVDLDTKQQLRTVTTIGIIGSSRNGTRFTVPEKYRDKSLKDESDTFSAYPVKVREQIAAELKLNPPDAITFTVGEKEKIPSYKSTKDTFSTTDLYHMEVKAGRGVEKNGVRTNMHIKNKIALIDKKFEELRTKIPKDLSDDEFNEYIEYYKKLHKRIDDVLAKNKDDKFGQTSGSARYSKLYNDMEWLIHAMELRMKSLTKQKVLKEHAGSIDVFGNDVSIYYEEDMMPQRDSYDPPLPYEQLPIHLKDDPVHVWRAKTGIELIHQEPTLDELERIWGNWNLMTDDMKKISDARSIELFHMTNEDHYHYLVDNCYAIGQGQESISVNTCNASIMEDTEPDKNESLPENADKEESKKNGVNRKKLYIAFIEWCKEHNPRNTFGSIFDKDAFATTYSFIPHEMRYFYRLANPILCVVEGNLTFFAMSELKKVNIDNSQIDQLLIFAATEDTFRVFNLEDKKVYIAKDVNGKIELGNVVGQTFDLYIQRLVDKGDILGQNINID